MSRQLFASRLLLLSLYIACMLGCGESKKSLHEMDHVTPQHWPVDLTDAANKLTERMQVLSNSGTDSKIDPAVALKELSDIVGWIPEVAADTDLAEGDWMKLYEASEIVRKKLLGAKTIEPGVPQDIEKLCSLLIEAQALIPKSSDTTGLSGLEESAE